MKKGFLLFLFFVSSLLACHDDQSTQTGSTHQKMSVDERLKKARAAKAAKRLEPPALFVRATPADYQAPTVKEPKGPNGEVVHVGERGAKFYINKNGHKTYLSSNR